MTAATMTAMVTDDMRIICLLLRDCWPSAPARRETPFECVIHWSSSLFGAVVLNGGERGCLDAESGGAACGEQLGRCFCRHGQEHGVPGLRLDHYGVASGAAGCVVNAGMDGKNIDQAGDGKHP